MDGFTITNDIGHYSQERVSGKQHGTMPVRPFVPVIDGHLPPAAREQITTAGLAAAQTELRKK